MTIQLDEYTRENNSVSTLRVSRWIHDRAIRRAPIDPTAQAGDTTYASTVVDV